MRMLSYRSSLLAAAMLLLVACGGAKVGPGPQGAPTSTGLAYQDPAGAGWRLVRNAASSGTHVILDVVGPTATKGRGIGFNLLSDGTVKFARLGAAGYIADTGVFKLQSTFANYPVEPTLVAGGLKLDGTLLTVGIFQKDRYWPAVAVDVPVAQIAIDFDPVKTAALAPGTVISLKITKAKAIPEDIGAPPPDPSAANADWSGVVNAYASSLVPVTVAVGTLTAR